MGAGQRKPTLGLLVIATGNRHKTGEFKQLLSKLELAIRDLADYPGLEGAEEDGDTYELNAVKKALHVARESGEFALADDSGLEIDALGGRPGIYSSRLAPTNNERLALILHDLSLIPTRSRTARFICVTALADPRGYVVTRRGVCEGAIAHHPLGAAGFGYDPIFLVPEKGQTMAQLAPTVKNRLSHRARATREIAPLIEAVVVQGKELRELEDFAAEKP